MIMWFSHLSIQPGYFTSAADLLGRGEPLARIVISNEPAWYGEYADGYLVDQRTTIAFLVISTLTRCPATGGFSR